MTNHNISIEDFAARYRKNCEWLFVFGDRIDGYNDLVKSFGAFSSTHQEFITEFVNYTGDPISGDREAAFMLTLMDATGEGETATDAELATGAARLAALIQDTFAWTRAGEDAANNVPLDRLP